MRATIAVWSPTLLEVKLHRVPASLLVSLQLWYFHRVNKSTSTDLCFSFAHTVPELSDLMSELQDVNDWVTFGLYLGIRMPKLEAIKVDCPTLGERRIQMLNEWQNNEIPTWFAVVQALDEIGMRRLASELAQKHGWLRNVNS